MLKNEKCVIVVDGSLPLGLIANTCAIMGITLGKKFLQIVGGSVFDKNGNEHLGIIEFPVPILQAELKEVKRRIDNLVAAIEQGILTPSTKARMEELEKQREALETSILQEQIEKPLITREQILFWFDQFRHGDPADIAFQEKVIDCFVNSIYLFDDRIVVNFNYQEGGRPVSLEEVLGSFLDGNGAPR